MAGSLESNKATVQAFYDLAFNVKKPADAVSRYMGKVYRQHNPGAGDGPEPFISYVTEFVKAYPELRVNFKRFIAEEDLVVVHSHMVRSPGDRGKAVVDIFRLEAGKIVEHWDVLQEVPEKSANANTMF